MFKFKKPAPHLGIPTYNSPGQAPRRGTPAYAEAEAWQIKHNQWLASTVGKGDKSE
jgi:hypothetical protein